LEYPNQLSFTYEKVADLRYGENPHQKAAFYKEPISCKNSIATAKQLHGKEISFNNINDTNGALDVLKEFGLEALFPTAVAVKHANPCGVGIGADIYEAYLNAYNADPVSIFGGIVALNRPVDKKTAEELSKTFLEVIIAPAFSAEAFEILSRKKNIRLFELPDCAEADKKTDMVFDIKKVAGGLLVQQSDAELFEYDGFTIVTERMPTEYEAEQLKFAWKVVKHVKSNAIVLAKDSMTIGIGPGQTNRITALELAIKYAGDRASSSVMASDAFFPFGDCVEAAFKAGITAIIQPGGSVNDKDSIELCNKYGIAMIFTGMRHFKH
jgi:phosphoribosylaminoimidazolecarboxamide formyltransferase/IMP cyclohydrolase